MNQNEGEIGDDVIFGWAAKSIPVALACSFVCDYFFAAVR